MFSSFSGQPYVSFPNINGSTVTAEENTTLSVEFFIIQHNCSDTVENVTVSISKEGENKDYAVQCIIRQRNRKCLNRTTSCGCHPDTNAENGIVYKFTKTVTRSDMVPWKWWTEGDVVTKSEIQFNISCMLSLSVSVCLSVCLSLARSLAGSPLFLQISPSNKISSCAIQEV